MCTYHQGRARHLIGITHCSFGAHLEESDASKTFIHTKHPFLRHIIYKRTYGHTTYTIEYWEEENFSDTINLSFFVCSFNTNFRLIFNLFLLIAFTFRENVKKTCILSGGGGVDPLAAKKCKIFSQYKQNYA